MLIRHKHVDPSVLDYGLEHYMPCLPAKDFQHTFQTPPQAWAAHLQQLRAPPVDTDTTAGHSKLAGSAIAGNVAEAQPGSAASSSTELMQEQQQQQQQHADVQSESARTAEVKPAPAALSHFPTPPPAADVTIAQIDTMTRLAPLPKVGRVKTHSSAVDRKPAVSTAEVNVAEAKSADGKAAEAKSTEAKATEARATEAKSAKGKAKGKAPTKKHAHSSSDGASTRPTPEQDMPNLSSK